MSRAVSISDQAAAIEAAIMDNRAGLPRQEALGAALKTLRLIERFEAPYRKFFMFCLSETAKAEADLTAQEMLMEFPEGKLTLTVRA